MLIIPKRERAVKKSRHDGCDRVEQPSSYRVAILESTFSDREYTHIPIVRQGIQEHYVSHVTLKFK